MTKQTFLRGTLILIMAGMITRLLGFVNRLVVARVMGEEGMGLYMMAIPTLILALTLTQIGLPIAISKRVAENIAKRKYDKVKKILVVSLIITGGLSILFMTIMMVLSPWISQTLYTDDRVVYPLLAVSPVIPIIAISSVIKGYFQGRQNMKPQSYALIIEQVIRISCVALFIKLLLPYGVEFAAAGAMASMILGEFCSLLYLIYLFKRKKTFKMRSRFFRYLKSSKQTVHELFSIALPSTGSRMISSFTHFLEPILVAQSLAIAGVGATVATKLYGELTGYVIPLLFLPTFITQSLSIALVPAISESEANQNRPFVHYRIHQAIRISFASGALATIVFSLFASPILNIMYGTDQAARFLIFMAPFYLLLYIQAPLQSALQALDLAKEAMWNSLIGAGIKLVILYLLASNPNFKMMGVAIAMCTSVILVTLLHLYALRKTIAFSIPIIDTLKMLGLLILTFLSGKLLSQWFVHDDGILMLGITLFILTIVYVLYLFGFRFISRDELKQLPILNKWLS